MLCQKHTLGVHFFAFIIDRFDGKIHISRKNVIKKRRKTENKGSVDCIVELRK